MLAWMRTTSASPRPFPRADERLARELQDGRIALDKQVFWGLLVQWGVVLLAVLATSASRNFTGADLLCAALLMNGVLSVRPLWLTLRQPGERQTRLTVAVCQGFVSTLLLHVTDGRMETHLHLFVWLIVLAGYRDVSLLLAASAAAVVSHVAVGLIVTVPGLSHVTAGHLVEHAVWLAVETACLTTFIRVRVQAMSDLARREAALESLNNNLERKVERRTREMSDKLTSLQREYAVVQEIRVQSEIEEVSAIRQLSELRQHVLTHATTLMDTSWRWSESHFEAAFRPNWRTIREATQQLLNLVGNTGLSGMSLGESLIGGPVLEMTQPVSDIAQPVTGQAATCDFTPLAEQSGPKTLLLIDDPVQQALAEHALAAHGFRVDVVHTGPRTYYSAMLREYELILVDVDLADDEGFDTIEALRLLPQGISDATGLFALSRARSPEAVLRSTQLGIDGFFVKPLTVEALRAAFEGHSELVNDSGRASASRGERETAGV